MKPGGCSGKLQSLLLFLDIRRSSFIQKMACILLSTKHGLGSNFLTKCFILFAIAVKAPSLPRSRVGLKPHFMTKSRFSPSRTGLGL